MQSEPERSVAAPSALNRKHVGTEDERRALGSLSRKEPVARPLYSIKSDVGALSSAGRTKGHLQWRLHRSQPQAMTSCPCLSSFYVNACLAPRKHQYPWSRAVNRLAHYQRGAFGP